MNYEHSNAVVLDSGRIVFSNAKHLFFIPYVSEDQVGSDIYDLVNIVGDTLSVTPDDNTINSKDSEFKDEPLFENVVLGKVQFAGTCIDFQNPVMEKIFGWNVAGGIAAMPTSYKDKYAAIIINFGEGIPEVVLPKVKMNSKAVISTLKTGSGEGNLAGTAYAAILKAGDVQVKTSFCFVPTSVADYEILSNTFTDVTTVSMVTATGTTTFTGKVDFSGGITIEKAGFKYRKGTSGAWTTVDNANPGSIVSGANYTATASGLAAGNYQYYAYAEVDGNEIKGAVLTATV